MFTVNLNGLEKKSSITGLIDVCFSAQYCTGHPDRYTTCIMLFNVLCFNSCPKITSEQAGSFSKSGQENKIAEENNFSILTISFYHLRTYMENFCIM